MEFEPLQPKVIEPKTETYTVEDLDQAIEMIKESENHLFLLVVVLFHLVQVKN